MSTPESVPPALPGLRTRLKLAAGPLFAVTTLVIIWGLHGFGILPDGSAQQYLAALLAANTFGFGTMTYTLHRPALFIHALSQVFLLATMNFMRTMAPPELLVFVAGAQWVMAVMGFLLIAITTTGILIGAVRRLEYPA